MSGHILITGGASGIGLALARVYWEQGNHIHLLDIDEESLISVKNEFDSRCSIYPTDLLNPKSLQSTIDGILNDNIPISRLINNAGITHRSKGSETNIKVFENVMGLNWQVPVALTQKLIPTLKQNKGKIINIVSMAGLMPVAGRHAYCASKSALHQHFETWRPELKHMAIDLLMVYPSFVQTNIEKNALGADGRPTQRRQTKVGNTISAKALALSIAKADGQNRLRLLSTDVVSRLGYWLWRFTPYLYQRISNQKFKEEWQ